MADYIYPFGDAPDDAEYVLGESNQDIPNGLVLLPGPGIQIQQGPGTITITNIGGGDTADQTYWTADDETSTLPNSFRVLAGSNVSLTYGAGTVTISASGGGGGGGVSSVSAGNATGLFTTSVSNPTTTPNITFNVVSNIINDLASATGIGILTSTDGVYHAFRTIQGTVGEINVTNGSGAGGNPTLSLDSSVYTDRDSSVLNALATGLSGTGFVSQNGAQFYDRTLTGTSGRLTVSNGTGATGNPVFDVGPDVLVVGDVTALPGIQIVNGTGVIQVGASGALGGTLTNLTVGDVSPVWVTNVNNPTTTPNVTFTLNNFASGALLIGPKTGSASAPTVRRLLGQDIYDAVTAGSNVTLSLVGDQLVISSTASGGGGGTVTRVTSQNLPPLFTTTVNTDTTTPDIQYTFSNAASANFLAGPASGPNGPWINRGILGTDLTGALQAGANITITQSTPPDSRLVIAITGQIDASLIANGSVDNTEFQYLNGVTSAIQTQLDNKQPLDATLTALSGFNSNGLMTQTAADTFTSRTIAGTANEITVTDGSGVSGNPTVGLANNIDVSHLADGSVSNTEFQFLDGVTSNIQAQLNSKQGLSTTLNALSTSLSGTGYIIQTGPTSFAERSITSANSNHISITNGDGVAGATSIGIGPQVYTFSSSNVLNDLATSTSTGVMIQTNSAGAHAYRTLTGSNNVSITNGNGIAGDPTFDVSSRVYTVGTSNVINALSTGLASTGLVTQTGPSTFADRTLQGSTGYITITNGNGVSGDPTFSIGNRVFTDSTSNLLNALSSSTVGSTGLVTQLSDRSFVDRTITTANSNHLTVTNGSGVAGNPTLDIGANVYTNENYSLLNYLASTTPAQGQVPMGQSNGSLIYVKPNAGAGIQLSFSNGVFTIAASGANGGTITQAYQTVQEEGSNLTQRNTLNFIGGGVTAADDSGNSRTNVTLDATLNALAAYNTNGILTQTAADTFTGRTITGTTGNITVTDGDGVSGNPTVNVGTNIYTRSDSSVLNALATGVSGTGILAQNGASFNNRTLTGTGNRLTITNGTGSSGNPTFDVGTDVYTISSSNTLNSLASTTGTGFMSQNGAIITDRTLTGTANRITITNGTGAGGNPVFDVGSQVYTISSSNVLNDLATSTSTGVMVQTDTIGNHAYRTLTGTANEVTVTNGNGVSGNPTFSLPTGINVTKLADGSVDNTEFQYLNGVTSSIQTQLDSKLVSAGDLSPLFTTNESAGNIAFTFNNVASANFLRGPASGSSGPWVAGGILGTDLTGALEAGSNITITQAPAPGSRLIISSTGSTGYSTIQEEGSNLTQRSTLNFIGGGITAADDSGNSRTNVTLDATLNSLAAYNTNGILTQTAADTFTGRTITGTTGNITVTNGDGIAGNPTLDVGTNVYTRSQSSLLNYLASTTPTLGQIPMGASDGSYRLTTPNAGSGIQLSFANGVFTIAASGMGSLDFESIDTNTTLTASNKSIIYVPASSSAVTLTLPSASAAAGKFFWFRRSTTSNNVVVQRAGSDQIFLSTSSVTSISLNASVGVSVAMFSNGVGWYVVKPSALEMAEGGTGLILPNTPVAGPRMLYVGDSNLGCSITLGGTTSGQAVVTDGTNASWGVVGAAGGGTGLSTTPANNQFLVGDGAGYSLGNVGNGLQVSNLGTLTLMATGGPKVIEGRITLLSASAVPQNDITGATTIYYTPYIGNTISLWSLASSGWVNYNFTEKSVSVPATTSTMYDVYMRASDQSLQLVAWTSQTVRASEIVLLDGVWVRSGQADFRWLGCIMTGTVSGQTADSAGSRYCWNAFNRVVRPVFCTDTTNTWTYSSAAFEEFRNQSTEGVSRVGVICGLITEPFRATVTANFTVSTNSARSAQVAIGLDSSTAVAQGCIVGAGVASSTAITFAQITAEYTDYPGLGYHTFRCLEAQPSASATVTWKGDNGGTFPFSGMTGLWSC